MKKKIYRGYLGAERIADIEVFLATQMEKKQKDAPYCKKYRITIEKDT